tara:strand:+ start:339 stop:1424 length:1086 start_codon:yes stop_codon:yes gene_type:complete
MEIKVREITTVEEKSVQEVEKELLDKHEKEISNEDTEPVEVVTPKEEDSPLELKEEDVLSYIKNRYDKQINSVDELLSEREASEDLPEDVAAYFDYKKKTGRSIEDYVKLNRDFTDANPDVLLKEYLSATEEGLDSEDIDSLMDDYSYDEDLDDEADIRKIKVEKKKIIAKAKKYFEEQKQMYKEPLESSGNNLSEDESKEFDAYKQYVSNAKTAKEETNRKAEWFSKKSDEVFSNEFKGFEFDVDGNSYTFTPGDASELKKAQETPMNFIGKYLDENGMLNDATGYHRSLAIAMNPDKFAKFFYEQGKSEATEDVMRKTKNVNMTERRAPEATSKGGTTVRAVTQDSGRGLKIRSKKNRS